MVKRTEPECGDFIHGNMHFGVRFITMFTNLKSKIIKNEDESSPNIMLTSDEVKAITANIPLYEAAAEYMVMQGYWSIINTGEKS